jgi:hypothetical protein
VFFFKSEAIDFSFYIETILTTAYANWLKFGTDICEGKLKFRDVFYYKKILNNTWEHEFRSLMEVNKLDQAKIALRFKQISIYDKVKGVSQVSKTLLDLKEKFKLTGDFSYLNKIIESVSKFKIKFFQNNIFFF